MEEISEKKYLKEKKQNERYNNINSSSPLRLGHSFDNTLNRNNINQNFSSYNIDSENKNKKINLEKYNNIRPISQTFQNNLGYQCRCQCGSYFCPYYHHCSLHHIHFHHIHIPHIHYCPRLNYSSSYRKVGNQQINNNDLLNEVAELKNECKNIKEELEKTKTENKVGNKYIELLENKINMNEKKNIKYNKNEENDENENDENEKDELIFDKNENNLENKYHNMLNKSFEVLNSVSSKCDEPKGKIKGGVNYYINKDPDYDELIEAQKRWLDNLPEKKIDALNYNNNSTFSNTNGTNARERFNQDNNEEDKNIYNIKDKDYYNENYFQNMSDFNKSGENKDSNNLISQYNNNKHNININDNDYDGNLEKQKLSLNEINYDYVQKYKNKPKNYLNLNNDNNGYANQINKGNKNFDLNRYNNDYKTNFDINNINKDNDYMKNRYNNNLGNQYNSDYKGFNENYNKNNDDYSKNIFKEKIYPNKKNDFNYMDYKNKQNKIPIQNKFLVNNEPNEQLKMNEKPKLNKKNYVINNNKGINISNSEKKNPFENYNINDNTKKPSLNANDIKLSVNNSKKNNAINRNIPYNKDKIPLNNNNLQKGNQYEKEEQEQEIYSNNNFEKNQIINYPKQNLNNNNNNDYLNQNDNNINNIQNQENENEEINPLNERYIIIDKNGNPIFVGGVKLLGMELIPLIGEDGKEVLDDNGNIILIGPDGKPKTQDELEPILLDDDKPLVNEENRPFLGLNGVPLINGYGSPVLGPGELYDKNNRIVKGFLGFLAKDNMGNPIKVFLDDIDNNENYNNNEIENNENYNNNEVDNDEEEEENNNIINNNMSDNSGGFNKNNPNENFENMKTDNLNSNNNNLPNNIKGNDNINKEMNNNHLDNNSNKHPYDNLRPLLGSNGKPVKDAENNYVLLDEYNRPVKNTGITLLLDQTGKPVLNSKSKPILIDIDGNPINLEDNSNDENIQNLNSLINPDILYPNPKDQLLINNKKPSKKEKQPFYQKINSFGKNPDNKNTKYDKGYLNDYKKPRKSDLKKKKKQNFNYDDYNNLEKNINNPKMIRERNNIRDKRNKGKITYSQCSPDSIRKLNFMGNNEYKGACFACDVGCSISRSGYSPMNYSPYNNLIRRRDITPLKNNENVYYEGHYNTQLNNKNVEDNNYY